MIQKLLHTITLIFILSFTAQGTHLVGGEIYYECVGPNTYKIYLKIYRDCAGIDFDDEASVAIYSIDNGVNVLHSVEELIFPGSTQLPVVLNNPCLTAPPSICTELAVYTRTIVLPNNPEGYNIVHQRCCRNSGILNIVDPGDQGNTYMTYIPGDISCNNSAYFAQDPPLALCANEPFVYNHSAIDPDGDVLTYEFYTPLDGGGVANPKPSTPLPPPYTNVPWQGGFSTNNQITANPAFTINPTTGVISGTPTQPGLYVVGILVKEYRNGVLINENRRDYQFTVVNCAPVVSANFNDQNSFCDGQLTRTFSNSSFGATHYKWDFGVSGTLADTSNQTNPTFTFPSEGSYDVTLIVNPGWPCSDTMVKTYHLYAPISGGFNILSDLEQCKNSASYDFEAFGDHSSAATITWDFGNGASPATSNQPVVNGVTYTSHGVKTITLTVEENGCSFTETKTVTVLAQPQAILTDAIICNGLTVSFPNTSIDASTFLWDFGVAGTTTDVSTDQVPVFTFPTSGDYLITLIANPGSDCSDTVTAWYKVKEAFDPVINTNAHQCLNGNSFDFNLTGKYSDNATFKWSFGSSASQPSSTVEQPQNIVFNTVGIHTVTLNIVDEGCAEFVEFEVTVYPEVSIDFEGETEGCAPVAVNFTDLSYSFDKLDYFWDFGDGNTSTEQHPTHTYETPGVYDVTLTIVSDTGCATTLTLTKENFVTVYEVPTANFDVTPEEVTVFHPEVTLRDYSRGGNFLYYVVDGVDTLYDPNTTYNFVESGDRTITQYIQNEFGCVTTLTKTVYVEPTTTAYVPNAFSPNGDGVNDFFIPVIKDVTEYELFIFNRWGNIIFNSTKLEEGWDGNNQNGNQAQQDVYVYRIRYRNVDGFFEIKEGHVTLIK